MGVLNISMALRFPPDSLLSTGTKKNDVELASTLLKPADNASVLIKAEELNTMISGEDESSSVLNGRLRPRKSTATLLNPANKPYHRHENKVTQDKPKRNSTPSKASPNKQDDLTAKADSPASPVAQFLCPYCDRKFTTKIAASKHARRIHLSTSKQDSFISCLFCNHSAAESNDIIQHMVDSHSNQYFACLDCHTRFTSSSELAAHELNVCEKQKQAYRNKLRQKTSPLSKKDQKKVNNEDSPKDSKETKQEPEFNGLVISCELKPSQGNEEVDIEDKITTNLILPSNKTLANSVLEKNAVIILDDVQWKKRIPPNFSFHNADADQILSRLGVVHRSPRVGESSRREWLKMIDDSNQKFEKCFDTNFYARVASNVQENLARFVDGTFNFSPDPDKVIKTRKSKSTAIINTAEGFPILLPHEQYSRNSFDGYMPRAIAPKHKWKWDSTENEKHIFIDTNVMKRDNHVNQCIITLVSSLDIWTQLRMRRKFEGIFCKTPTEKMEKQNIIGRELKEILESREIPCSSSQVMEHTSKVEVIENNTSDFPSFLGLSARSCAQTEPAQAVLSGEWVRPRCYVCCACGDQTRDARALTAHMSSQHPNAQVQHYDIVGESLLDADILKHLYVPPSQMSNRTRPLRGFRDCTKCKKSITLEDLHQHMLDCAGDTPTVRRKVRSRPFGVRKRRPRLSDNSNIRKKIRKDIRTRHNQKALLRARPRIRTEVGDAETIRKMLADLPAKRHRQAAGHPTHHVLRPRRKIEKQRSKLKFKRLANDETHTRKQRAKYNTDNSSQLDEDDQPLKLSVKLAPEKTTPTKKRFSSRLSKNVKTSPTDNIIITVDDLEQNASSSGGAAQSQHLSSDHTSHRLDVNRGTNDRREEGNNETSKNDKNDDHTEEPGEDSNQNDPIADSVQLKHSINSITASSNSQQLSQQSSVSPQENAGETKQNILENNTTTTTKPDKPPLLTNQKRCSKKIQRPLHLKLQSLSNCIEKIAKSKKQTKEDTMFKVENLLRPTQRPLALFESNPAVVSSSHDASGTVMNVTPGNIPSRVAAQPSVSTDQNQTNERERYYRRSFETEQQKSVEKNFLPPRAENVQRKSFDSEFAPPRVKAPSGGRRRKSSGTRASLLYEYEQANMTAKLLQQQHPYGMFPNPDPHSYLRALEQNIRHLGAEGMPVPELLQLQYREIQDIIKYSHLHCFPPLNVGFTAAGPYTPEMLYEDRRASLARYNMDVSPQLMYNATQLSPVSPTSGAPMLRTNMGTMVSQINNNYSVSSMLPMEMSPTYSLNIAATQRASQHRASESSEADGSGNGPTNASEGLMQYYSEPRSTPDMRRRSSENVTHRYKQSSSQAGKESHITLSNTYKERKTHKEFNQRMNGSDLVTSQDNVMRNIETASNASDSSGPSSKTLLDQVEGSLGNTAYTVAHSVQDHRSITHLKGKSSDVHTECAPNAFDVSQRIIATSNLNKHIIERQVRSKTSSPPPSFPTTTMPAIIFSSSNRIKIQNCDVSASTDSTYRLPEKVHREQIDQEDIIDPGDSEVIEQPLDLSGKKLHMPCNENVHIKSADENKETDNTVPLSHESDNNFLSIDSSNQNRKYVTEKSNKKKSGVLHQPFNKESIVSLVNSYEQDQITHGLVSADLPPTDKDNNIPSKENAHISSNDRIENLPLINNDSEEHAVQNKSCPNETCVVDAVHLPAPQDKDNEEHAEQVVTCSNETNVVDAVLVLKDNDNEERAEQMITCSSETNVVDAVLMAKDNDNEQHPEQIRTRSNETNVIDTTPKGNDNEENAVQKIICPNETIEVDAVPVPQYIEEHAEQNKTCFSETNVVDAVPTPEDNEELEGEHVTCQNETYVADAMPAPQDTDDLEKTDAEKMPKPKLPKTPEPPKRPRYKSESDIFLEKLFHASSPLSTSHVNLLRINNMCKIWPMVRANARLLRITKPVSMDMPGMNEDNQHANSAANSEQNINIKDSQRRDYNNDNKSVSFEDKGAYAREILSILFNHDSDIERKMNTLPKELVELLYIVPRDQILKYLRVIPSYLEHIMTENTPLTDGQDIKKTMEIIVAKLFEFLKQLYMTSNDEINSSVTTEDLENTVEISAALKILAFLEQLVMTKTDDTNTPVITVEDLQNVTQPIEELLSAKILSFLRKLILIKKYAVHTPLINVSSIDGNKKPTGDAVIANSIENRLTVNTIPSSSILPKKRHSPSARLNSQETYSTTQSRIPVNKQPQPSIDDNTTMSHVISDHLEHTDCDSKENISKIIDLTDDDYHDIKQAITGEELVPKLQVLTKLANDKTASLRAVRIKSPWSRKSQSDEKQAAKSKIGGQHAVLIHKDVTQTPERKLNSPRSSIDIVDSNLNQSTKNVDQYLEHLTTTQETNTEIGRKMSKYRSTSLKKSLEMKETGSMISDDQNKKRIDPMESTNSSITEQNNIMQHTEKRKEVLTVKNTESRKTSSRNSSKDLNDSLFDHVIENGAKSTLYELRSISSPFMENIENTKTYTLRNTGNSDDLVGIENDQKQKTQDDSRKNCEENLTNKPLNEVGQRNDCDSKKPITKFSEDDSDDDMSLAAIVQLKNQEHAASAIETKVTKSKNKKGMTKLIKKEKKSKKKSHKTFKNASTEANLDLVTINVTLNNIVNKEEPVVVDLHNVEVGKSQPLSKSLKNNKEGSVNIDVKTNEDITIREENIVSDMTKELVNEFYNDYENKIYKSFNITEENNKLPECQLQKNIDQTDSFDNDFDKNKNKYARSVAKEENEKPDTRKLSLSRKSQVTVSQNADKSYRKRKNNKSMEPDISFKLTCAKEDAIKSQSSRSSDLTVTNLCLNGKTGYDKIQNVSLGHEFPLCERKQSVRKNDLEHSKQFENFEPLLRSDLSDDSIEGSSLNMENSQKPPFTKKQLIFSKYLMDESNHNESDANLFSTSHDDESTSVLCLTDQPVVSQKSEKIRSKNNKTANFLDEIETNHNCVISKNTVKINEFGGNAESGNSNLDYNSMTADNDTSLEFEDKDRIYIQFTTKEKRKFNLRTNHDTSDSNKAKRIKPNINDDCVKANVSETDKINTSDLITNEELVKRDNKSSEIIQSINSTVNIVNENSAQDHNDNRSLIEKPNIGSEIKTACYNRPIINKQVGLPATLPDKNPENYDPYDINLEVMAETAHPVLKRKGNKLSNNKASKITKKCSTTEDCGDVSLKQLSLDESAQQTGKYVPPSLAISDSESSVSDVPLQKYVEEKEKMKSVHPKIADTLKNLKQDEAVRKMANPNDTNEMCTKDIDTHINYTHDGLIHSSDTSINKTSVVTNVNDLEIADKNYSNTLGQNSKYESNQNSKLTNNTETDTDTVKPNIKQKKNRRSLASEKPEIVSKEPDQQLSSDKYMENFGFYSVRQPRKSNLLASKKISETFHMIESDDVFFTSKSRQRKSSHSENRKASGTDCCSKTTQDTTTINEQVIASDKAAEHIEVNEGTPVDEPINYDGEVDFATAQKMLDSEEIRRLENELIVGFKEAAEANAGKTSGFNYLRAEEPISRDQIVQDISISATKDVLDEIVASRECAKKPIKNKNKTPRPPEYKEMMYPDEEVNIYEDKYDIIKRRRTQAAAAKQLQNVDEPRTITKAKKKAERKSSHKKCPKKPVYQVSQVPTKGALKGFDGIKISIPTQDLNMPPNVSPPHNLQKHRSHKKRKNRQKSRDRRVSGSSSKSENDSIKIDGSPPKRDIYEFEDDDRPVPQAYRLARIFDKGRNPSSDIEEKDQEIEVASNKSKQYVKEQMRGSNSDHDEKMEPPKGKIVKRKGKGKRKCNEDHIVSVETFTEQGKRSRKDDKDMLKLSYGLKPEKRDKPSHEYNRTNLDDSDMDDQVLPDTTNFLYRDDESSYETDSSAPAPLIGRNFDGECPCTCTTPTEIESDDDVDSEQVGCADSPRYDPDGGAKNLVMGKIFKNNAYRCDKNDDTPPDPPSPLPKPDLDLLFDSLLEQQTNTSPLISKAASPVPGPSSNKYNSETGQKHRQSNEEKDVSNVDDGFSSPNHSEVNHIPQNKYGREDVTSPHSRKVKEVTEDVYNFVESSDLKDEEKYIKKSKKHDKTEDSDKKHDTEYVPIKSIRLHLPDKVKKCKSHSKHKDKYLYDMHGSPNEAQSKRLRSDVEYSNDDDLKTVKSKKNRKSGKKHKSHHKRNKGSGDEKKQYNSSDDTPKVKHRRSNEEHTEEVEDDKETNGKRPPSRKSDEGISTSHDNSADAYDLALPEDTGVAVQRARRKCTVGKQNVLVEHWSSSESEASVPHGADSTAGGRRRKSRKHSVGKKSSKVTKKRHSDERASSSRVGPQPKIRARPAARDPDSESEGEVDRDKKKQEQHGWIVGGSHKKLVTLLVTSKSRHGEEERD